MGLYRRGGQYWIDFYYADKRHRRAAGENAKEARAALDRIRGRIASGDFDLAELEPKLPETEALPVGVLFESALALYLESRYADGKRSSSYRMLRGPWSGAFNGRHVDTITAAEVEALLSGWRETKGWTAASRNVALAQVGGFLSYCYRRDWIARHPLERGRVPMLSVSNARQRWLRPHEVAALVTAAEADAATAWLAPLLRFAVMSGARLGEITGLRLADLQRDARERAMLVTGRTKNGDSMTWPLEGEALRIVEAQAERCRFPADYLFPGPHGGNARTEIRRHLRDVVERAGLVYGREHTDGITFHTFRHSMASIALNNGVPEAVVQKMGNWRDRRMVARYAKVSDETLRDAAGKVAALLGRGHTVVTVADSRRRERNNAPR